MEYYLSPKEVCKRLDIDHQTLRKMASEGRIDWVRPTARGHRRYNILSVEGEAKRMSSEATAKEAKPSA